MNTTKVLIKIHDPSTSSDKWAHLCYIDSDLFNQFASIAHDTLNDYIKSWSEKDFKEPLLINSLEDIEKLKALIKAHYKKGYPELFYDCKTDRQGWTRVWISSKMREVLLHEKVLKS